MELSELKTLRESGEFHHATYRNQGTLWEGLHIYCKDSDGFRGFRSVGFFSPSNRETLALAEDMVRGTGISVGAYGQG